MASPSSKTWDNRIFTKRSITRPSQRYTLCSAIDGSWGAAIRPLCNILELSSYRLVCKGGTATTPYLSLATNEARTKPYRVENGSLMVPVEKNFSLTNELEGFHRLPKAGALSHGRFKSASFKSSKRSLKIQRCRYPVLRMQDS